MLWEQSMRSLCMLWILLVVAWRMPFASALPKSTESARSSADEAPENDCRCWAGQGQCRANAAFMEKKCRASCLRQRSYEDCVEKVPKLQSRNAELSSQINKLKADAIRASDAVRREQKLKTDIADLQARLQQAGSSNLDGQAPGAVCASPSSSNAAAEKIEELTTNIANLEQQLQQKSAEAAASHPKSACATKKAEVAAEKVEALKAQLADFEAQLQQKDRERKTEVDQLKVATFHAEDAKKEATKQIQLLTSTVAELESRLQENYKDKQGEIERVKAAAGAAETAATEKIQALIAQVSDLEGKLRQKAEERKADQRKAEELHLQRRDESATETIRKLTAQISDLKVQVHRKGEDRQQEIEQLRIKVMRAGVAAQEVTEKTQENEQLRSAALRAKMGRQADADRIKTLTVKVAELETMMRQRDAEKQVALDQVKVQASRADAAEHAGAAKVAELTQKVTEFEEKFEKNTNSSNCDDKQLQADAASEALHLRVRELEVELLTQTAAYYQMSELRGTNATFNAGGADPWYSLYEALLNLPSNISQVIVGLPANLEHLARTASWAIVMGSANVISQTREAIKEGTACAWNATVQGYEESKVQAAGAWRATEEGFSKGLEATKNNAAIAANSAQEFLIVAATSIEQAARHPYTRDCCALFVMIVALIWWLRWLRSMNASILLKSTAVDPSATCCDRRMHRRAMQEQRSMQVLGLMAAKAAHAATTVEEAAEAATVQEKVAAAEEEVPDELVVVSAGQIQASSEAIRIPGDAESAGPQRPLRQGSRVLAMAALVEAPAALKATHAFQQQMSALQAAQSLVDAAVGSMALMCQEFQAAEAAEKRTAQEKMAAKALAEKAVKDVLKLAVKKAAKEKQAADQADAAARTVEAAAQKLTVEVLPLMVAEEVSEEKGVATSLSETADDAAAGASKVIEDVTVGALFPPSLPSLLPAIVEVAGAAGNDLHKDVGAQAATEDATVEKPAGPVADDGAAIENSSQIHEQMMVDATIQESAESLFGETAAGNAVENNVIDKVATKKQAKGEADENLMIKAAPRLDHHVIQWLRKSRYVEGFLAYICVPILLIACMVCLHMHGHLTILYESALHLWEAVSDHAVAYQTAFGNATASTALGMATVSVTTAPGVKQLLTACEDVKNGSLTAFNHVWMSLAIAGTNHFSHLKLMLLCCVSVVSICWLRWLRSLIALSQLQSCINNLRIAEDGKFDSSSSTSPDNKDSGSSLSCLDCKVDRSSVPCPVFDMASDTVDEDAHASIQEEVRPDCARPSRMIACACFAGCVWMALALTDLWATVTLYTAFFGQGLSEIVDRATYELGVFVVAIISNLNSKQLMAWWEQIGSLAGQAADQSWMVVTVALLQCVPCIGGIAAAIVWLTKRKAPSPCSIEIDLATDNQADVLPAEIPSILEGDVPCPIFDMAFDESEDGVLSVAQDASLQAFSEKVKPLAGSLKRHFRTAGVACAYLAFTALLCFLGLLFLACGFLACAWLHVHGYLALEPYYEAFEWFSKAVSEHRAAMVKTMEDTIQEMGSEHGWDRIKADLKSSGVDISIQALGNFTAACLGVILVLRWLKRGRSATAPPQLKTAGKDDCHLPYVADGTEDKAVRTDAGDPPIKKHLLADPNFLVSEKVSALENANEMRGNVPCGSFGQDVETYVYHRLQA